jgi:hypothetical protein
MSIPTGEVLKGFGHFSERIFLREDKERNLVRSALIACALM